MIIFLFSQLLYNTKRNSSKSGQLTQSCPHSLSGNENFITTHFLLMEAINSRENLTITSLLSNCQYVSKHKILSRIFLLPLTKKPENPYLSSSQYPMQMLRNRHFDIVWGKFMQATCRLYVGFMQDENKAISIKYRKLQRFYVGMQAPFEFLHRKRTKKQHEAIMTQTITTCKTVGVNPSMLAPGSAAILVRTLFSRPTTYNNRYAREGTMNTKSERQRISVVAGMTTKFVRRKQVEKRPK